MLWFNLIGVIFDNKKIHYRVSSYAFSKRLRNEVEFWKVVDVKSSQEVIKLAKSLIIWIEDAKWDSE